MKSKLYLSAVALAAMALFGGCAKDGATGPQGPAGYDGNANVIGTLPFTAVWTLYGSTFEDSLIAYGITQDIVDKGSVQVFIQYGSEWWALPDVNGINSNGAVNSTTFGFGAGYLKIWNTNSDGTTPSTPYPPTNYFRAVIISASNRMANPNINWKNYKQVKAALNLPD